MNIGFLMSSLVRIHVLALVIIIVQIDIFTRNADIIEVSSTIVSVRALA